MTAVTRRRHRRWRAVGAFLKTIPGALTALATLLTAIAGLLAALAQVGVITIRSPIVANPPAEERTVPQAGAGAGAGTDGSGATSGGQQGPALVYLDELAPLKQTWYREGARAVNGRDFARSVAIRQPSRGRTETTVFNLGRHYSQLRFSIGLWDGSDPALQSICQVFADQQVIFDSGTMTRGTSAQVVEDVSDAFDLTISCTPTQAVGADGEVVLADAQLTAKPARPRPPPRGSRQPTPGHIRSTRTLLTPPMGGTMGDHTYTCTTAGCPRQRQPTGARWCVACSTPTEPELAAPREAAPAGDPAGASPGRPLLSDEWRQSAVSAAIAAGAMLAFGLLLVGLLAVLTPGEGERGNLASLLRLAVTLVPLSMRGALVVEGSARSTGADQGELSLVLPPLLGAVVGLTALAVATSRRVRRAPPATPGPLALEALRTGAAFAALMGLVTLLTSGTVQDPGTGKVSWHVAPIGVACWSLLLGTLASGLGAVAALLRTGRGRELLAAASPAQRGWLRALGGGAVAAGTALLLGAVAVAVLVGVGMSRYAEATQATPLFQIPPAPVVGLVALFLPGAAIQPLGLGLGATLVAGSPDDKTSVGYLAGSGLPGWAYLLLLVPALAVLAGGLWTAAREQAEPQPQPGGWLRYAAVTTALFGLLLVLARIKVEGGTGGVGSVLPLPPSSGQDRGSAVIGFRLFDGLLLAFAWAALGGVVGERLFPVLLTRHGRPMARVRVGGVGLLPAPPATPQGPAAPRRRPQRAGMLAAAVAVAGVAAWLGAGHGPAGTPDGSAAAEAATSATTVTVPEPTLAAPPETLPTTAGSSPQVAGGSEAELAADATASASDTAPDSVDAAGNPISYSAGNLTDGDQETAWRAEGDGRGLTLTLTLPSAARLTRVGLVPGYAKVDPSNGVDRFPENRRVRVVRWRFDDGTTVDQRFADSPTMQETAVEVTTRSVTIELLGTRPGTPDHDYVPISEVSLVGTGQ